ncbi:MAG: hypothetical protein U0531_11480 [Dehalococcoidia bacterium]
MNIFDRLAQGPSATQQSDYDTWNEMVGSAPPERFGRAGYDAIRQVDPREYYEHTQPGVGGSDPFGALQEPQRKGLAQSILGELFRRGLGRDEISRGAGVGNLDPDRMSPSDLAAVTQWMQREQPKAFGRVAAQYQDQPNILQSLLGNKALMLLLGGIGAKLLFDRSRR